ncbi:hypothetical protein LEP1GSC043_1829 [Leptospira weilii str. Ecochallenge]|uniref:Uncharacterized protein n=1 Tax=Leptospira weilii str. Ecochallenge TaxID=1049986 RepID=N1U9P5_9LEPT|nr:hypothetical protein LEP1GSC043_1829 [Leptospira weilii str. Ecochallenge]
MVSFISSVNSGLFCASSLVMTSKVLIIALIVFFGAPGSSSG